MRMKHLKHEPLRSTQIGSIPDTCDLIEKEWVVNIADKKIFVRINDELVEPETIAEFIELAYGDLL